MQQQDNTNTIWFLHSHVIIPIPIPIPITRPKVTSIPIALPYATPISMHTSTLSQQNNGKITTNNCRPAMSARVAGPLLLMPLGRYAPHADSDAFSKSVQYRPMS